MGQWPAVVLSAGLGVVCGPLLAAWTCQLPTGWPAPTLRLAAGGEASARRVSALTLATAVVFGLLAGRVGAVPALPAFLLIGAAGVVLAVIDAEHHRLPDRVVAPAFLGGTALLLAAALIEQALGAWLRGLVAAAALAGVLLLMAVARPGGLGLGDVKLGGLLGLALGWLGWGYVVTGVFAGFVLGAVVALLLIAARRATLRTPVAFGPALLVGALLAVATGPLVTVG